MERLTKKFTDGVAYCEEIEDVGIKSINSKTYVGKAVDKLTEYEDLEEKCIEQNGVGLRAMIDKFGEFIDDIEKYNERKDLEEKGMLPGLEIDDNVCKWEYKHPFGDFPGCKNVNYSISRDSNWKYCPYCGKKIKVVK